METENYFHLSVTGEIVGLNFPILMHNRSLYCRYDIVYGADWEFVSGLKTGVTQNGFASANNCNKIVYNMPIEFTLKSTNPFGWPQIVFSIYGKNFWGTEICQGYARAHIPLCGEISGKPIPIIVPKCSNIWSSLVSWITDKNPELRDPKILIDGTKTKSEIMHVFCHQDIMTESYGEILVNLQILSRGIDKMGFVYASARS